LYSGRKVVIGEACIVGRDAQLAFTRSGYVDLAARYGVELVDLDHTPRYEQEWAFGRLKLPEYLLTHEYIDVAKMKCHIQTGVTLGLKNQKGLLDWVDKRRFHSTDLDGCIRALGDAVKPALTIIDGIVGLEGNGPWLFGTPRQANLLIAGTDVVEVDNVGLRVMGFSPGHAKHIPNRGHLDVVGLSIDEARTRFRYDWPGYFLYRDVVYEHITDSCSGCNQMLYIAFKMLPKEDWARLKFVRRIPPRLDLVLGRTMQAIPAGAGTVVCVGKCARDFAKQHDLPLVNGCPPEPQALLEVLLEPKTP
jgi:hypothetical protein